MAEINGEPAHLKVFNLPQHAAVKIRGFQAPEYDLPEDAVLLFDRLEDMQAFCVVEGTKNEISIDANTSIVELGGGEYQVEEQPSNDSDRAY